MKKFLINLFAFATVITLFCGCKANEIDGRDPSKKEVVVNDSYNGDGNSHKGSIAILSDAPSENVNEAAALRFLGGITTDVTENTVTVLVDGNPANYVYEINEVLDRGGAVFLYDPQKEEVKEWADDEDNLMYMSPEFIDEYEFDKVALFGFTMDGSIYTYEKADVESLEAVESEADPSLGAESDSNVFYTYAEDNHDDIYDSSEYQMLGGVVKFLLGLEELENSESSRAASGKNSEDVIPNVYQRDIEIRMEHDYGDHRTWNGTVGHYCERGVFSIIFNIIHAFDFDGKGDFYLVDANFQAHCNTFCKPTWQPDQTWRRHTAQGDVLKYVTFEAEPKVGSSRYSVKMARRALPENIAQKTEHTETSGFNIGGSLTLGAKDGEQGGKGGEIGVKAGYNWSKTKKYVTKEWEIVKSGLAGSTVGYSIVTSRDLESTFDGTTRINVKPNARGTIEVSANWVWNVPETEKNTDTKGISSIRVLLKDLKTKWFCVAEDLISKTEAEQYYGTCGIDIPLQLTDRTEYGVVKIVNDLPDPIIGVTILNDNGGTAFISPTIAVATGDSYTVSLPTSRQYTVMLEVGKQADATETYQYIKRGGRLLTVSRAERVELRSSVNFSNTKDASEAIIVLKNNKKNPISYIKLIDFDTKKVISNSKNTSLAPGSAMSFYVQPKKKYTIEFACKSEGDSKFKKYEFTAPDDEDQFIMVNSIGERQTLNAENDFSLK